METTHWYWNISFGVRRDQRTADEWSNVLESGGPQINSAIGNTYTLDDLPDLVSAITDGFFNGEGGVVQSWVIADEDYVCANVDELRSTVYGFNSPSYDLLFDLEET